MTAVHQDHEAEDGRPVNPTDNPTFASVLTRRELLKGAAAGIVLVGAAQSSAGFASVAASNEDKVIVPPGYRHSVVVRWGDPIFSNGPEFDPTAQTAAKQGLAVAVLALVVGAWLRAVS